MSYRFVLATALWMAAVAATASAQTPFSLTATEGNSAVALSNGGILTFTSIVGQAAVSQVSVTYTGTGVATITTVPVVSGSMAFLANSPTPVPAGLDPGQTFVFSVEYLATTGAVTNGQVTLSYSERTLAGSSSCPTSAGVPFCTTTGTLGFTVEGAAFSFSLSYVLQSTQNALALSSGGNIVFPPTPINTSAQASLMISNTGGAPGVVTNLTISGAAFRFQGIPALPLTVGAGQTSQVQILYQPTATTSDTGQIQITFSSGSPVMIGLQGSGSSPNLVYQILQTNPPTTVPAGGTVTVPSTNVGQSASVTIRVLNIGNAAGAVTTLLVNGPGFQLSSQLPLPQTLAPNASITFVITFTPTQPLAVTGTLSINSDSLNLSGTGLGAQLTFSYGASGTTVTIGTATPSVVFSPVAITQSVQVVLDVKNTGTLPTVISNIGITQANSPFTIVGPLSLPVGLAPNSDFKVTLAFTPVALGFSNGTVQFDAATIPLLGSGTQPPPLPSYTITGPSGNAAPMSQPTIGLTLASPYPVAVSGTLSLTVAGSPVVDPAVQFSTGGVTVPFAIPANSTAAVFAKQGNVIGLQTGTVASTIVLTPAFATMAGGVDLTPATPQTLQLAISAAAPTLIAAQIGPVTTTAPVTGSSLVTSSFVLTVTGFSTPRSLSAFNVQFTAASGFNLPTTQFKVDLTQLSALWFQSSASHAFGSEFSLAVPFTFQGAPPAGETLLNSIGGISVSMTNSQGTSNTLQVN